MKRYLLAGIVFAFILNSAFAITNVNDDSNRFHNRMIHENDYSVSEDVVWANPEGMSLTMDIYTPETDKDEYPVFIIFHGGGWLANDKSIMDDMSEYIVKNGDYVVCNVNYRLLKDQNNTVTMDKIVEDAFGAVLWIKENIRNYKGNPYQVAVSGDSAGGHLAAMVVNSGTMLDETGLFQGQLGFKPTYMPTGIRDIIENDMMEVQAAVLNYAALDIYELAKQGYEYNQNIFWQGAGVQPRGIFGNDYSIEGNPDYYKAVSPIHNIPDKKDRKLPPQLLTVGTEDDLIAPELIQEYTNILEKAGHPVEYWEHEGRPHAFLDSGINERLGTRFEDDATEALDKFISFLDDIFN